MKHGFIKAAAVTPKIKVADTGHNTTVICEKIREASDKGAKLIVFPELCITGYTCGDLFRQCTLLREARKSLVKIAEATVNVNALVIVGLPVEKDGRLYNVAAVLLDGDILGMVPQTYLSDAGACSEKRYFTEGNGPVSSFFMDGEEIPFGTNLLFQCENIPGFTLACELGADLCAAVPPASAHALMGATVIADLSASHEEAARREYRELLVKATSARLKCAYLYASAGEGESTQDFVFGGHNIIAENGACLAQSELFSGETVYADIDVECLLAERYRSDVFGREPEVTYTVVPFALREEETVLDRAFAKLPFVPEDIREQQKRCREILNIQAHGLKKRYEHTGVKTAVLGLSGGLDSTLALLVTVKTFELLGLPGENIHTVTMPCFGTTDRTYDNACRLATLLNTTLTEVDIKEAVTLHFRDIGHDMDQHDVTYENSQARERTQVLMDISNKVGGLVIGTGDLSELALGWATYNGDHMSMYGVNAGIPKTLVRYLVKYYADTCNNDELKAVLYDILDTPVSPELLPPCEGAIAQKTEDLVGPYELHDFFLYYMLRYGYTPDKIYRMACEAYAGEYTDDVILKWMKTCYRRFFTQQFKRSCLPDGPKTGSVGLSPRGDWRMPSDACGRIWLDCLEQL